MSCLREKNALSTAGRSDGTPAIAGAWQTVYLKAAEAIFDDMVALPVCFNKISCGSLCGYLSKETLTSRQHYHRIYGGPYVKCDGEPRHMAAYIRKLQNSELKCYLLPVCIAGESL